ncbi:MAG TPA: AraC family transcriptional regulator [Blastocatellia bacterium]|nr:AraC family transcriptional regulator [Blastocatellia bacterium]
MILRRFPGTRIDSGKSEDSRRDFSFFGRRNVVVYATSRDITFAKHTAPLSIKSTLRGQEVYEVSGVPMAVDESSYLVLNRDQPYASYICSAEEVESFCIFFRDGLEQEVAAPLTRSHEKLIDHPDDNPISSISFFQHLRRNDEIVSGQMKQLHAGIMQGMASELWLDEQLNSLMEALLETRRQDFREIESLPFVRSATRIEIYKRLRRAKDYIESCYCEPVSLSLLARVACLSRHHFLRLFKEAFHMTPHRYLTSIRLQKARSLIEEEGRPVADACASVGFENASSFARLFKQHFGRSPRSVRPAGRK